MTRPLETPPERDRSAESPAVADLLAASRAAHLSYRRFAGTCDQKGNILQSYDETRCVPAVELARKTRLQAHELDPAHCDPAWQMDKADHQALLDFYDKFLRT